MIAAAPALAVKSEKKRKTSTRVSHNGNQQPLLDSFWRISVNHYHQMIEAGILTENDPVELLEGWLIQKMPKGPRHSSAIHSLRRALERALTDDWFVEPQDAITLADSEPEPDIVVARGNAQQFQNRHPRAAEVEMVVEVSDATLYQDRGMKKRMYARAGIPIYWIVNLVNHQIEVYHDPQPGNNEPIYAQEHKYTIDDTVPVIIAGEIVSRVAVAHIIPPE